MVLTCNICGTEIRRKGDMPRHMRMHSKDKEDVLHRCSFEGCQYSNIQRSNVTTHMRTHTREKNQQCPSCEFSTSDPGSLTRHRKRKHGYIPQTRNARLTNLGSISLGDQDAEGTSATSRASRKHQPYPRPKASEKGTRQRTFPLIKVPSAPTEGELRPAYTSWFIARFPGDSVPIINTTPVPVATAASSPSTETSATPSDVSSPSSPSSLFSSDDSSESDSSASELECIPTDQPNSNSTPTPECDDYFWLAQSQDNAVVVDPSPKTTLPADESVPQTLQPGYVAGDTSASDVQAWSWALGGGMGTGWDAEQLIQEQATSTAQNSNEGYLDLQLPYDYTQQTLAQSCLPQYPALPECHFPNATSEELNQLLGLPPMSASVPFPDMGYYDNMYGQGIYSNEFSGYQQ
ncbi:hypothetical protein VNI00_000618 [Paramarasmius palmivorus]|uniref:C2H2-type domain-containing protein n=1 Tax=Paramarasmius palmivorus TaxID=297713 RepID=A0AAW0E9A9_9AGAR